jgi:endonuclease YncB( thermonuclease family)
VFTYPAQLVRCVDADTLRLVIDVGFNMTRREASYRLSRVDAPELSTDAGKLARAALEGYLLGKTLVAQTFKSDSFGRYITEVWADGANVSDWLVQAGHATYKTY